MPKNWDYARERVHLLYIIQRRPLREVVELMHTQYGFRASLRAYKQKIKEWRYIKNGAERHFLNGLDAQKRLPEASQEMLNIDNMLQANTGRPDTYHGFGQFSQSTAQLSLNSVSPQPWQIPSPVGQGTISSQDFPYHPISGYPTSTFDNFVTPLISGDNNPDKQDSNGRTRLHHAAISGSFSDVETCVSIGAAIDVADKDGNQPIHHAALGGFTTIVIFLLKRGAEIDAKGHSGRTLLHLSIKWPQMLKALLQRNPTVSRQDDNGDTPLHLAVDASLLSGPPERSIIKVLIESGSNINIRNNAQITPFHTILAKSRFTGPYYAAYVTMFLDHADILSPIADGRLPFELFLDGIGDSLAKTSPKNQSSKQNRDWKLFISKGADLDVIMKSGELLVNEVLNKTYLGMGGDRELVQLVCNTAAINKSGATGDYPLHCILRRGGYGWAESNNIKSWLIERGADPNQRDGAGQSPLITYLAQGPYFAEPVRMLLDAGANPFQRDDTGQLPVYVALKIPYPETRETVLKILLNVNLWKHTPDQTISRGERGSKDLEWWLQYYQLYSCSSWQNPKRLIESASLLPADVASEISQKALTVLVEKFVELVKTNFETMKAMPSQEPQLIREELVRILRDCQSLNIRVDDSWYRLLVDLQD